MADYTATTKLNDQTVTISFSTHYAGASSECRECGNYFPAEGLGHDPDLTSPLKFVEPRQASETLDSLRVRLKVLLFCGRPICPKCMETVAAREQFQLKRE